MILRRTLLPGILLLRPTIHRDERGTFLESWQAERYEALGIPLRFLQDNLVHSRARVLRGLHLQLPKQQGKLVQAVHGDILDVVVDVRRGSPTFGRSIRAHLSAAHGDQIWVPPGFAHGYCVLSEEAIVSYKCTELYAPGCEVTLRWDDPDLGIEWPWSDPLVSPKDAAGECLADIDNERLPVYRPDVAVRQVQS